VLVHRLTIREETREKQAVAEKRNAAGRGVPRAPDRCRRFRDGHRFGRRFIAELPKRSRGGSRGWRMVLNRRLIARFIGCCNESESQLKQTRRDTFATAADSLKSATTGAAPEQPHRGDKCRSAFPLPVYPAL